MRKIKNILTILLFLALYQVAQAQTEPVLAPRGGEKGNGATVVLTFKNTPEGIDARAQVEKTIRENDLNKTANDPFEGDILDHIEKVEMVDLYLQKRKVGGGLTDFTNMTMEQIYKNRIAKTFEKSFLTDSIHKARMKLQAGGIIDVNEGVVQLDDANLRITNSKIKLPVTMALQKKLGIEDTVVLYREKRLFDKMDAVNQAAFFLHEELYRVLIDANNNDVKDATAVQFLVGVIFDKGFESIKPSELKNILIDLKFLPKETKGTTPISIYVNSQPVSAYMAKELLFTKPVTLVFGDAQIEVNSFDFEAPARGTFHDYFSLRVQNINYARVSLPLGPPVEIHPGNTLQLEYQKDDRSSSYHTTGLLLELPANQTIVLGKVVFQNWVKINQDGKIAGGELAHDLSLKSTFIPAGSFVMVDPDSLSITRVLLKLEVSVEYRLMSGAVVDCQKIIEFYPESQKLKNCNLAKQFRQFGKIDFAKNSEIAFFESELVQMGTLARLTTFTLPRNHGDVDCAADVIWFHPNGSLKRCQLTNTEVSIGRENERSEYEIFSVTEFYPTGHPVAIDMPWQNARYRIKDAEYGSITMNPRYDFNFFENGQLKAGRLIGPARINGTFYDSGTALYFDENGRVTESSN
jgi:hypothetical protein